MQKHTALSPDDTFPGLAQLAQTLRKIQRNVALSKDDQLALSLAADTLAALPLSGPSVCVLAQDEASFPASPGMPPVPAEVLAAAQRLATLLHVSRVAPELAATAAADQHGADLVLSFLRSLDASSKAAAAQCAEGLTSEQATAALSAPAAAQGSIAFQHRQEQVSRKMAGAYASCAGSPPQKAPS